MSPEAASFTPEVRPGERVEVLFEELSELSGQRNAIDSRIVEIVAAVAHRLEAFPRSAAGMREGRLSLDQVGVARPDPITRLLLPLPEAAFETGRWFNLRVDRHSQITVRTNRYSVPVRFAGRQVRVQLYASHLEVYCDRQLVATHKRLPGKAETRLELDHYLEILLRKPGDALPGSTALEQARAAGRFTPVHDAWWAAAP